MPEFDDISVEATTSVYFSVYCGDCGTGICGECTTDSKRMSISVNLCPVCRKAYEDNIRDLENQISELEEKIEKLENNE